MHLRQEKEALGPQHIPRPQVRRRSSNQRKRQSEESLELKDNNMDRNLYHTSSKLTNNKLEQQQKELIQVYAGYQRLSG